MISIVKGKALGGRTVRAAVTTISDSSRGASVVASAAAALSCASAGTDVMVANNAGITRENFIAHPFSGGACINAQTLLQPICISLLPGQSLPWRDPQTKRGRAFGPPPIAWL